MEHRNFCFNNKKSLLQGYPGLDLEKEVKEAGKNASKVTSLCYAIASYCIFVNRKIVGHGKTLKKSIFKITLAFMPFFSSVSSEMRFQIACSSRRKVT